MISYTYTLNNAALTITEDEGEIIGIGFETQSSPVVYETELIKKCYKQILEYENGKRRVFDFPYRLIGTDFQIEVWEAIMAIPYGQTTSYRRIAEIVGRPRAARAVGTACNRCPMDYLIPCQRVLASSGLGGYGKHIDWKIRLLELESQNS